MALPSGEIDRLRWPEVKRLFLEALGREPGERGAFVASACGDDRALREEVESLLAAHDESDEFLEVSALQVAGETLEEDVEGRRLGPYRVVREIGRGGMGTVYLAERDDGEYRKRVAIKVIRRGMDTDAIIRRFRYERQILADLDHPSIARLLDSGATDDGLPYFVMEYIEGEPIDRYCRARNLGIEERLDLFRRTCEGIDYAHRHLIVHRDLKPGNILVTAAGVPKLLDFGLAKVLGSGETGATAVTMMGMRAMTPEYASPEQIRGDAITTASDVYSLGVVLYELLTDRPPYTFASRRPDEMARTVCEQEPPRPSASASDPRARRHLRGDLDNIVGLALRKEPERRYATVEQLSHDVLRHLKGLPVHARPDTLSYRTGKFLRRHTISVGAAALVLLSLVGGIVATAREARIAEAERARAEQRFEDIRRLARLFIFDYNAAIEPLPGSTPIRERMVRDAFEYLDLLAREAGGDPQLQIELADGYVRVGEVQARLGDYEGSLLSHRRALALHRTLAAARPDDDELQRKIAHDYVMVADRLTDTGDATAALEHHRRALDIRERLHAAAAADPAAITDLMDSVFYVGRALHTVGRYDAAIGHFRRLVSSADSMAAADPAEPELARDASTAHHTLAMALVANGDLDDAVRGFRRSVTIMDALSRRDPANAGYWQALSRSSLRLARTLALAGDPAGALRILGRSREISERLSREDPANAETRNDLMLIHGAIGDQLTALGRLDEALASYRRSASAAEALIRRDPAHVRAQRGLAATRRGLGDLHVRMGDAARGVAYHRASLSTIDSLAAADAANVELAHEVAIGYERLGRALQARAAAAPAERAEHLRAACDAYARSGSLWDGLRRNDTLSGATAGRPDEVALALERCRGGLARAESVDSRSRIGS